MAVPNITDVENYVSNLEIRLNKEINNLITIKSEKLKELKERRIFKDPARIYEAKEEMYSNILEKLNYEVNMIYNEKNSAFEKILGSIVFKNPHKLIESDKNKYQVLLSKIETLNPISTIKRGYAIARNGEKIISSVKDVKQNDKLNIELSDGKINVEVI